MKRSLVMFLLAATVLLLASQATAPLPASAHTGTRYHAVVQHSFGNKCLQAMGSGQNAVIKQYLCDNGLDQQFDITHFSDGLHQLKFKHSNMCLDVPNWPPGHAEDPGVQLEQYPCNGGDNQKFFLPSLHGTSTISSFISGFCLDVYDAAVGNGANVVQYWCNGGANQQWGLHNDTATRLKTTFPDRWDLWGHFYVEQEVDDGLVGLWGPLISNAFDNWTNTDTAVILTERTPGYANDIAVLVNPTGVFMKWGLDVVVAPGLIAQAFFLNYDYDFVCPSVAAGLTCTRYRAPEIWEHAIAGFEADWYSDKTAVYAEASVTHELGHALGLRHDNRPNHNDPEPKDGKCGVAPMKKTIMDYDCFEDGYAGQIKEPQPWDECGLNHLYWTSWGYSGCN